MSQELRTCSQFGVRVVRHTFSTVVGDVAFNADGEWVKPRHVFSQWQHLTGNSLEQASGPNYEVVVWPKEFAPPAS